jgi:hypothetical protein
MQCAQSDDKPRHAGLRPDPLTRKIEKGRHNRRSIRAPTPFTDAFRTATDHENLSRATLQERLLLCLNGIGTNTGLKRMASGQSNVTYRMGANEQRGLTPLFWGHVNPYGTFQLDMTARLTLDPPVSAGTAGQLPLHGV